MILCKCIPYYIIYNEVSSGIIFHVACWRGIIFYLFCLDENCCGNNCITNEEVSSHVSHHILADHFAFMLKSGSGVPTVLLLLLFKCSNRWRKACVDRAAGRSYFKSAYKMYPWTCVRPRSSYS